MAKVTSAEENTVILDKNYVLGCSDHRTEDFPFIWKSLKNCFWARLENTFSGKIWDYSSN